MTTNADWSAAGRNFGFDEAKTSPPTPQRRSKPPQPPQLVLRTPPRAAETNAGRGHEAQSSSASPESSSATPSTTTATATATATALLQLHIPPLPKLRKQGPMPPATVLLTTPGGTNRSPQWGPGTPQSVETLSQHPRKTLEALGFDDDFDPTQTEAVASGWAVPAGQYVGGDRGYYYGDASAAALASPGVEVEVEEDDDYYENGGEGYFDGEAEPFAVQRPLPAAGLFASSRASGAGVFALGGRKGSVGVGSGQLAGWGRSPMLFRDRKDEYPAPTDTDSPFRQFDSVVITKDPFKQHYDDDQSRRNRKKRWLIIFFAICCTITVILAVLVPLLLTRSSASQTTASPQNSSSGVAFPPAASTGTASTLASSSRRSSSSATSGSPAPSAAAGSSSSSDAANGQRTAAGVGGAPVGGGGEDPAVGGATSSSSKDSGVATTTVNDPAPVTSVAPAPSPNPPPAATTPATPSSVSVAVTNTQLLPVQVTIRGSSWEGATVYTSATVVAAPGSILEARSMVSVLGLLTLSGGVTSTYTVSTDSAQSWTI
ncbi:hypothetical protein DFJ73DRAFT_798430 [Zopfochytrium polystomum]|nr:hypothetical protein DFJ73DRAFT_798430 [Zopfochytrium polystomum]